MFIYIKKGLCLKSEHNITATLPLSPRRSTRIFRGGTRPSAATRFWAIALSLRRNLMGAKWPHQLVMNSGGISATWSLTTNETFRRILTAARSYRQATMPIKPRKGANASIGCVVVVKYLIVFTPFFLSQKQVKRSLSVTRALFLLCAFFFN